MGAVLDARAARRGAVVAPRGRSAAHRRVERRRVALALGALMLAAAFVLWTQARQVHLWSQDEEYFVQLSRLITEHLPTGLWDLPVQPFDERGIQRLTVLALAWPLGVVNGELGFDLARGVLCLSWASAAIPAFWLARGVGLGFGWSWIAAALTLLVPWATVTGSFLTEAMAYPAALWVLWGAWRACVVPGLRSDLLALGLVLLAGLVRTNLLVLVVVAPVAVLLHTVASAGLPRTPAVLWREHRLFALLLAPGAFVVALALAGLLPGPLEALVGNYIVSLDALNFAPIPEKWAGQVSRIAVGIGVLPAILGVPWVVRQAVRRTSTEAGALALSALTGFLVVLFSTVYAAPEERYLMLVAPFILLPGIVAVARGEVPAWAVAVSAALVALLVARVAWPFAADPSRFLTDPVEAFWSRVVVSRVSPAAAGAAVGVLGLLALVATAARGRVRSRRLAPLALLAAVVAIQAVQTGYAVGKRTQLVSGPGTLPDWTWVDRRAERETVGILAAGLTNGPAYGAIWRDVTLWNRHVEKLVSEGPLALQIPRYGEALPVAVDPGSGRLEPADDQRIPELMLVTTQFRALGLAASPVARSTYLPVELVRLRGRPRVTYRWSGTDPEGWLLARMPRARLELFPAAREGLRRPCLTVTLVAPPRGDVPHRFTLAAGGERRTGLLRAGGTRRVTVPLRAQAGTADLRGAGFTDLGDGRRAAIGVVATQVSRCR